MYVDSRISSIRKFDGIQNNCLGMSLDMIAFEIEFKLAVINRCWI